MEQEGGMSKEELRKLAREAKKDKKLKAKAKKEGGEDTETKPEAPQKEQKPTKEQKPKKEQPKKTTEHPKPAKSATSEKKNVEPEKKTTPPPQSEVTQPPKQVEPQKTVVKTFLSDFPDDWSSGAIPLLAALKRMVAEIMHRDDHDCSMEAATAYSSGMQRPGRASDLMLRHFDEVHLRPFLASKLYLNSHTDEGLNCTIV